ncbi:FMN-dependent NADH-azoreductase [Aliidongia dinghuensis]|uniref:FMN dependent NADH:quinone oxidoreductase n=1 Tax=Aliidongia dinghuensis TaxID=1867774 RepID=A0A8J2Z0C5_9PROT|nr:FMN-dependent NADH-azoreductase [Aliidongia dinghuensis]GGF49915.1 FMN-dependent NADH-azoreductase [Aliidongia dinghuensis]
MSQILVVTASPRGSASYSNQVADALVAKLKAERPGATVVVRNLADTPLDHVGEAFVTGRVLPPADRSAAQAAAMVPSDAAIAEVNASDVIVIASPMYNFGVPSTLKAWIDHLARPGVTFSYSANGPEGLIKGKKVYLVEARGGVYSEGPYQVLNFQEPYLKAVLGFLGIKDLETITVEGIGYGPEAAEKALNGALGKVAALAA